MNADFLWEDNVSEEHYIAGMQSLINSGQAWLLEGSVGRSAMDLIEQGRCVLGEQGHKNAYGGYVPSRTEVAAGTKGSIEYAERLTRDEDY